MSIQSPRDSDLSGKAQEGAGEARETTHFLENKQLSNNDFKGVWRADLLGLETLIKQRCAELNEKLGSNFRAKIFFKESDNRERIHPSEMRVFTPEWTLHVYREKSSEPLIGETLSDEYNRAIGLAYLDGEFVSLLSTIRSYEPSDSTDVAVYKVDPQSRIAEVHTEKQLREKIEEIFADGLTLQDALLLAHYDMSEEKHSDDIEEASDELSLHQMNPNVLQPAS